MDYKKCATEILEAIGGASNIVSAAHCATRLRLVIVDNAKIKKDELENIDGVKGIFEAAGQLQIIIGTGTVNKVYDEMIEVGHIEASTKEDVKQAALNKQNIFVRLLKVLGDIFVPIIPAIVACGILMGLLEGLTQIPALSGMTSNNWYVMLHSISNAAFACLPVLIAVSAGKTFKCNILLAALIGIIMVHPGLTNAWNIGSLDSESLNSITLFSIGNWHIYLQGFQGHVIPVIISVYLLSVIEKKLHKIVPEVIDLFVTPLVSVLVTGVVTFLVIGPVFATVEDWVLFACNWFIKIPFGFGGLIIGSVYALTVIAGLHHMYNAIEAGLIASTGFNPWMPIASCVNTAQGAASLAVGLKTKNKKLKAIAIPAALSAYLGITEPALFGVNLRYKKPLVAGCIGGAVGGWLVALIGVKANTYGVTGIFGILITLFSWQNLLLYLLGILVASAVSFVITFFIFKDDEGKSVEKKEEALTPLNEFEAATPINGNIINLSEVNDNSFASGVLGNGIAIVPELDKNGFGYVYAPFDCEVQTLFETKHAIGLVGNGLELLIHVGINTVELNGEGFEAFVSEGAKVSRGDLLLKFNGKFIKEKGYDITTPVVVTNTDDFKEVKNLSNLEGKCISCLK